MTNDKADLHALVRKTADGDFLRDMTSFAAQRLPVAVCAVRNWRPRFPRGCKSLRRKGVLRYLAVMPGSISAHCLGSRRKEWASGRIGFCRRRLRSGNFGG